MGTGSKAGNPLLESCSTASPQDKPFNDILIEFYWLSSPCGFHICTWKAVVYGCHRRPPGNAASSMQMNDSVVLGAMHAPCIWNYSRTMECRFIMHIECIPHCEWYWVLGWVHLTTFRKFRGKYWAKLLGISQFLGLHHPSPCVKYSSICPKLWVYLGHPFKHIT